MKKHLITLTAILGLAACSGNSSEKIATMQKKDKNLTCREVLLEQNEAEFYRSTAEKNKNPGVKSFLMPLGYISTYMSAEDAITAANARTDYLSRIYEIMDCDNKLQLATRKNKLVSRQLAENSDEDATPAIAMPAPVMAQPVPQAYPVPVPMGYTMPAPQPMAYQPMGYQMPQAPQGYYQPMSYRPAGNAFESERWGRAEMVGPNPVY